MSAVKSQRLKKKLAPKKFAVPKLSGHSNGQAYITYGRRRYYLGLIGSERASQAYADAIQQIRLRGCYQPPLSERTEKILDELILLYLRHAKDEHGPRNAASKEFYHIRTALQIVSKTCGQSFGNQFGPLKLQDIQKLMQQRPWSARYINRLINKIKVFVRWCCAQELMPSEQYAKLQSVANLKPGRGGVPKAKKVLPVSSHDVQAVLPFLKPEIRDMVLVQYFCGMRPQDVTNIRAIDIDRSRDIWLYHPSTHKNKWRDKKLTKAIPPVAQTIQQPYLDADTTPDEYLFSPARSEHARTGKPSHRKKRPVGHKYTTGSYGHSLKYGFDKAERQKIPLNRWSLNQLRHAIVTELSRTLGQQKAQVYLGHMHLDTTAIYAERTDQELIEIAKRVDGLLESQSLVPQAGASY
jgi:integrase